MNTIIFKIFFFKKFLLSSNIRIKKTVTIKGIITPIILTSTAKAQNNDATIAFLYDGQSKNLIAKKTYNKKRQKN